MSNYKVNLSEHKAYDVRSTKSKSYKVTATIGGVEVPARFEDLINFDYTDKNNKYIIMYDSATQKYKLVNPDEVLSAASDTEVLQPGLPTDFVNTLDVDLDNRIDLDAGTF